MNKERNAYRSMLGELDKSAVVRQFSCFLASDKELTFIEKKTVFDKFGGKCFNCESEQRLVFDHTLPSKFLWPKKMSTATLLCDTCNNKKHAAWPGEFYSLEKLETLSLLVDISLDVLKGPAILNPEGVNKFKKVTRDDWPSEVLLSVETLLEGKID